MVNFGVFGPRLHSRMLLQISALGQKQPYAAQLRCPLRAKSVSRPPAARRRQPAPVPGSGQVAQRMRVRRPRNCRSRAGPSPARRPRCAPGSSAAHAPCRSPGRGCPRMSRPPRGVDLAHARCLHFVMSGHACKRLVRFTPASRREVHVARSALQPAWRPQAL